MNPSPREPATSDDLDQLEASVDARFQAINARFIGVDGRFAKLSRSIEGADEQRQVLERRAEARCTSIDDRINAARTQLNHTRTLDSAQIDHMRRELTRIVLLGFLGNVVSTAMLCLATIILAA